MIDGIGLSDDFGFPIDAVGCGSTYSRCQQPACEIQEKQQAMKFKFQFFLVVISFVFITSSNAQKATYWVVETNINQKNFTLVKFYDGVNTLLDEIKLNGVYLDISRRKHKKKLDDLLYQYNWEDLMSSGKSRPRKPFSKIEW